MHQQEHSAFGPGQDRSAAVPPPSRALVLCDGKLRAGEQNLTVLLNFFGIPWKTVSPGELNLECTTGASDGQEGFCLLSSAGSLAQALPSIAGPHAPLPAWMSGASSVYIYGFEETNPCRALLRFLTGSADTQIRRPTTPHARLSVTNDFPGMCGPMSGIQASVQLNEHDTCFGFHEPGDGRRSIITGSDGEQFISVQRSGVQIFLNACSEMVDLGASARKYFDVKEHFLSAVPIAMYLKWAFAELCWTGAEIPGCLIVDDPLLKPRYGFLRFGDALKLMESHNFTTTIAFIPWNWRRTNHQTVRQFQLHKDRLSLCVHGCDHTAGEFAARSTAELNRRIKTASQRMESLFEQTSLPHDQVMVFPQGAFSPESGLALKLNGFVAAVNTEVAPSGNARNDTKVADLWDIAILKYGGFPIFTRRYLTHGLENFAFDALLGKPCLMVAHHEVFKAQGRELMEFIGKLNSLNWNLRWCSLGDAISHSFKVRNDSGPRRAIKMYAEQLEIENPSADLREALVLKQELDPDCVKEILVNRETVEHVSERDHLQFRLLMPPGKRTEVRIIYFDNLELDPHSDGLAYRMKTRIRRRLSEFRDNYVSQNDFLYATAAKVKSLLN